MNFGWPRALPFPTQRDLLRKLEMKARDNLKMRVSAVTLSLAAFCFPGCNESQIDVEHPGNPTGLRVGNSNSPKEPDIDTENSKSILSSVGSISSGNNSDVIIKPNLTSEVEVLQNPLDTIFSANRTEAITDDNVIPDNTSAVKSSSEVETGVFWNCRETTVVVNWYRKRSLRLSK